MICTYEEGKPRIIGEHDRFGALEQKIASLESRLEQPVQAAVSGSSTYASYPQLSSLPTQGSMNQNSNLALFLQADALTSSFPYQQPEPSSYGSSGIFPWTPPAPEASTSALTEEYSAADEYNPALSESMIQDLLYPGYATDLPPPDTLHSMIELYFSKHEVASQPLAKDRFMPRLSLPPKHHLYPHTALLHSILAVALCYTSSEACGLLHLPMYYRNLEGADKPDPVTFHARKARQHIDQAMADGRSYFDVMQACVLLSCYHVHMGEYVKLWLLSAQTLRISTPCGLHVVENRYMNADGSLSAASVSLNSLPSLLPNPTCEEERWEKAQLFWIAYSHDRICQAKCVSPPPAYDHSY